MEGRKCSIVRSGSRKGEDWRTGVVHCGGKVRLLVPLCRLLNQCLGDRLEGCWLLLRSWCNEVCVTTNNVSNSLALRPLVDLEFSCRLPLRKNTLANILSITDTSRE